MGAISRVRVHYCDLAATLAARPRGMDVYGTFLGGENIYTAPDMGPGGILVVGVQPGSDAYRSGILADDILLSANGHALAEIDDLVAVKAALSVGDSIRFELLRSGHIRSITVRLIDQYELDNIKE